MIDPKWIADLDELLHRGVSPREAAKVLGKRLDLVVDAMGRRELTDRPLGPHVTWTTPRPASATDATPYTHASPVVGL